MNRASVSRVERVREHVEKLIIHGQTHDTNSQLITPMLGGYLDSGESSRCTTATHSRTSSEGVTPHYAVLNSGESSHLPPTVSLSSVICFSGKPEPSRWHCWGGSPSAGPDCGDPPLPQWLSLHLELFCKLQSVRIVTLQRRLLGILIEFVTSWWFFREASIERSEDTFFVSFLKTEIVFWETSLWYFWSHILLLFRVLINFVIFWGNNFLWDLIF